jgi:multidrug efflux pump subunit AcrA (membrane-fusion protein)
LFEGRNVNIRLTARSAIVATAAIAAAAAVTTWSLTGTSTDDAAAYAASNPVADRSVQVTRSDLSEIVTLPAKLTSLSSFTVAAPAAGSVTRLRLSAGERVTAGQKLFTSSGSAASSPVEGTFSRWLVADGESVAAGVPIAEMTYSGFAASAELPPEDAYRVLGGALTARAQISNGPGPFDCPILRSTLGHQADPAAAGPAILCAVPLTVKAFEGLNGTIAVVSGQVHNVLVLPATAIAGTSQSGEVMVVDAAGGTRLRQVGLGVTNGTLVEITTGLAEGDLVRDRAPSLAERQP